MIDISTPVPSEEEKEEDGDALGRGGVGWDGRVGTSCKLIGWAGNSEYCNFIFRLRMEQEQY